MPSSPPRFPTIVLCTLGLGCLFTSCRNQDPEESATVAHHEGALPLPPVSYNYEIRPLLARKCFRCHGRDEQRNESGLRLDGAEWAFHPLGDDPDTDLHAFVPGQRDQSVAWLRIDDPDPGQVMPPPESGSPLTPAEKELLGRWIDEGARYEPHWATQPLPANVPLPEVTNSAWPRNAIDHFVLKALEGKNLDPSPEADPFTLQRRLHLSLTGLAFDPENNAPYEEQVDSLLSSPGFGVRLGALWLSTVGYTDFPSPDAGHVGTRWPYRDWVIDAFNRNMPFDQFVIAQLAGDLLVSEERDDTLATVFGRLAPDPPSRAAHLDALLGLSLECARCHDHKSDPISNSDLQRLASFFEFVGEPAGPPPPPLVAAPTLVLPTTGQFKALRQLQEEVDATSAERIDIIRQGEEAFQTWLQEPLNTPVINDALGVFSFDERHEQVLNHALNGETVGDATNLQFSPGLHGSAVRLAGEAGVTFADFPPLRRWTPWTFTLRFRAGELEEPVVLISRGSGSITALNGIDLILDRGHLVARLARQWPGEAAAVRTRAPVVAPGHWHLVSWTHDGSGTADGFTLYLDGTRVPTETLADNLWKPAFLPGQQVPPLQLGWREGARGFKGDLDDFLVHSRALTLLEVTTLYDGHALSSALARHEENLADLKAYYFSGIHADARAKDLELAEARRAAVLPGEDILEVSVMKNPTREKGVLPGFLRTPSFEAARPGDSVTRAGLAEAIIRHPLAARVMVNRLWAHFFGKGLIETTDDLGLLSEAPSHPELLDWLARDFVANGWNVKRLCRQIVLSATFQQDSALRPEVSTIDPHFRLLAQGPSFPLSAPVFRDFFLDATGTIDPAPGGPPVSDVETGSLRRSLYHPQPRPAPRPQREKGTDRCLVDYQQPPASPSRTLDLDALLIPSRALASRVLTEQPGDPERLVTLHLRLVGRLPAETELADLKDALNALRNSSRATTESDPLAPWSSLILNSLVEPARYQR